MDEIERLRATCAEAEQRALRAREAVEKAEADWREAQAAWREADRALIVAETRAKL